MSAYSTFYGINENEADDILEKIKRIKATVIGDLSLDIYWKADMRRSELSRETPHHPLPVITETMSPGAGGNVAVNMQALGICSIEAISLIGDDWRGDLLLRELISYNINTKGIIRCRGSFTNAYCKPIRMGISDIEYEDPRIDFANYTAVAEEYEALLQEKILEAAETADLICICDQLAFGCVTDKVRGLISAIAGKGKICVVDSRYRISEYKGVYLKPNQTEALKAVEMDENGDYTINELVEAASVLAERNLAPVCMTIGHNGCIFTDSKSAVFIPSYEVRGSIDICGAGDTFLSAFSCALAAGADSIKAASFGNAAASVTIKKIKTTGNASPEEIRLRCKEISI